MIRAATPADAPAILRLNLESERFLSALDAAKLARLQRAACSCRVVDEGGEPFAFLLAFREGADYESENYRWFSARYPRFMYIDRVVVDVRRQGQGWGAALYRDLFALAVADDVDLVTCEFDLDPPNPVSARFHARLGFAEVGQQWVSHGGNKRVSMQAAPARAGS